jgi:hypothetical protein
VTSFQSKVILTFIHNTTPILTHITTRQEKAQQHKSKMVKQVRTSPTCFILFLLVISTSLISIVHSRNIVTVPMIKVTREDRAREPRTSSKRKSWMNHGSHRGGPRKHLVNPTAEDSFQLARELPV